MERLSKEQLEALGYRRGTWGPDHWCDWVWQANMPSGSIWECRNCKNRVYYEPISYSPGSVYQDLPECPAYAVLAVCER